SADGAARGHCETVPPVAGRGGGGEPLTKNAAPSRQGRGEERRSAGLTPVWLLLPLDQKSPVPAATVRPEASTLVTPSMSRAMATAASICAWLSTSPLRRTSPLTVSTSTSRPATSESA